MNDKFSFFDSTHVHIQGVEALRLSQRHKEYAEYGLIGFHEIVTIKDFRHQALLAIDDYLATLQTLHFPQQFNTPALTKMTVQSPHNIQIELFDTKESDPEYRLWANIGSSEGIPVYDYLYKRTQPMDGDRFAFLALYLRMPLQVQKKETLHNGNKIEPAQFFSPSPLFIV